MAGARARVKVRLRVGVRARARARATATANHGEAWSGAAKVDSRRAALDERVCGLQQQHVALGHERRRERVAPAAARREVEGGNARAHQREAHVVEGHVECGAAAERSAGKHELAPHLVRVGGRLGLGVR